MDPRYAPGMHDRAIHRRTNFPTPRSTVLLGGLALVLGLSFTTGCLMPQSCASDDRETVVVSDSEAARLLINRNWVHRWPTSKDDRIHVYRFVPEMGGGVYQDRTLFLGYFELFHFKARDGGLGFYFPDMEERSRSRFRIERVDGPGPSDLRLTIESPPRGPGVYYSIERHTGATGHELDAQLATLQDR